jgi:hypothetical protein
MPKTALTISGFALPVLILAMLLLSAGAFVFGKMLSPMLFEKKAPEPSPSALETQHPQDWQTQSNQKFAITFMLPSNWDSVELSDSLVIAPLKVVEDLRDQIANENNFGGGTFLTMQVYILKEDASLDTFKSTPEKEVSKKDISIGGIPATEYTTKYLASLPGIEEGAIIKTYHLEVNGKKYSIELLDQTQTDILQKILSTLKFINPTGSELIGKTKNEVIKSKGEPQDSAQNPQTKKEVWIFLNHGDDSTTEYVYFLNDKVLKVELDEYNGTLETNPWVK